MGNNQLKPSVQLVWATENRTDEFAKYGTGAKTMVSTANFGPYISTTSTTLVDVGFGRTYLNSADATRAQAWNFNASAIYFGDVPLFTNATFDVTVYLDSLSPFININVPAYAYMIDVLQVDGGDFWQCQDEVRVDNFNEDDTTSVNTTGWWGSCFSPKNCSAWDLLPTFNITTRDHDHDNDHELMMTTYSFLLNTTYYDKYNAFWQGGDESKASDAVKNQTW